MPLLSGLLVNLFGGIVAWFSQWVTRKIAFGIAAVTMMSGLTLAMFTTMRLLLSQLSGMSSGVLGAIPIFVEAIAIAVPPVAVFCVSTYITAWTGATVYKWQRDLIMIAMKA